MRAIVVAIAFTASLISTSLAQTWPTPVSYTHLTLPTIYSV